MEDLHKPTTFEINYRYPDGSTRFLRKTYLNYATALEKLDQRLCIVLTDINNQQAGLGIITSVKIGLAEKMDPEYVDLLTPRTIK